MTDEKRLYRSRERLVAGVCAGISEYFNVDPLVVRILAIVLTLASGGVLALAYVGLWIAVPMAPEVFAPLDVEPHAVRSDTYGSVDCGESHPSAVPRPSVPASMTGCSLSGYPGAGHVPPEPPPAMARSRPMPGGAPAPPRSYVPSYPDAAAPGFVPQQVAPARHTAPAQEERVPAPQRDESDRREAADVHVRTALLIGSLLLTLGVSVLASEFVLGASWWQFWPLVLVVLGILRMVLPDSEGWRLDGFAGGFVVFCVGATLMPMSLGIVAWRTIGVMIAHVWPLLCIALGCFVLGCVLKSSVLKLAASLVFAVFCAAGLLLFGVPGPVGELVLMAPYGREYRFPFFG